MHFEDSGVPLYLQLYEHLKQEVVSGKWQQDALIPGSKHLADTVVVAEGRPGFEDAVDYPSLIRQVLKNTAAPFPTAFSA
ncbi:hypothetical protein M1N08_00865 [Dehalococcoidia bacterium]|nr:hypothetical protein [Dehalococcoidia bacterium]